MDQLKQKLMETYYEDKELICKDCGEFFTFSGGEQRYYAERQFSEPKRCKPCRQKRKAAKEQRQET